MLARPTPLYVFDTSVWIDIRRGCPPDIFVQLWEAIAAAVVSGSLRCPDVVLAEVERLSVRDGLDATLKGYDGLFVPLDVPLQQALQDVLVHGQDLVDPTGQVDKADPYLIALAYLNGGKVVTDERRRRAPSGRKKIPDVCDDLGVPCLTWEEFLHDVGWRF
ncbi:MAG: DUF4411 family protein [Chloroflexi bacterium]|nr:DUF4411 family protein [Chloroflexota bacterium]